MNLKEKSVLSYVLLIMEAAVFVGGIYFWITWAMKYAQKDDYRGSGHALAAAQLLCVLPAFVGMIGFVVTLKHLP